MERLAPVLPCVAAAALLCASAALFVRGRIRAAVGVLAFATAVLQGWLARLDPFLHVWDEQFHALVAKHLAVDPLRPTLYARALLPYDPADWTHNHVWLHKPPLMLWQMAAAVRLLGPTELAVRLPTVLLLVLAIPIVFRIGQCVADERAGYLGAVLFAACPMTTLLVTGREPTDHNDVVFMVYVTASLWACLEYHRRRTAGWALAVGLLAGLAVLTKYLVGLLVFAGWAAAAAVDRDLRGRRAIGHLILAVGVTAAVALPWDVYARLAFPVEFRLERAAAHVHFTTAVEGHTGDGWFHLRAVPRLYGGWAAVALAPALAALLAKATAPRRAAFAAWLGAVYLFFTLAATKMLGFTYVASALVYVALGALAAWVAGRAARALPGRIALGAVTAATVAIAALSIGVRDVMCWRRPTNPVWNAQVESARAVRRLAGTGLTVVFGVPLAQHVPAMFYSDVVAYDRAPTAAELDALVVRGERVGVFDDGTLSLALFERPGVVRLPAPPAWLPGKRELLVPR